MNYQQRVVNGQAQLQVYFDCQSGRMPLLTLSLLIVQAKCSVML